MTRSVIGIASAVAMAAVGLPAAGQAPMTAATKTAPAASAPAEAQPVTVALAARGQKLAYVVVFDFACPEEPARGQKLADSTRLKLNRHAEFEIPDDLGISGASGTMPADCDVDKVVAEIKGDDDVVVARSAMFTCSDATQQEIV
jgi:hypothetical protein